MRLAPSVPFGSAEHQEIEKRLRTEAQPIRYHGELGPLARLFYKNVALSLLTLGIYRFWGKTHVRRYVWSHVEFLGERLEYLGTGRELLLGFLKTAVFVAVLLVIRQFGPELVDPTDPWFAGIGLGSSAAFGFLYLAAQYAAQRYRLTRTSWCGIRGSMEGSAWPYAFKMGGLFIVSALLIGLLIPWWRMTCLEMRISASRFGSMRANLEPGRAVCFWTFMLGSLTVGIANTLLGYLAFDLAPAVEDSHLAEALQFILPLIGFLIILPFAFAPYYASVQHEIFDNLSFFDKDAGYLRFASSITAGGVLWQFFTALLILVPTLGLGFPLVMHRWLKFTADNLRVGGKLDPAALRQATAAMPKASEGLLEALDPGIL